MDSRHQVLTSASPNFRAVVAEAFDPSRKVKAADLCDSRVNGICYIEGSLWERAKLEDGCLSLVLVVEHFYRLRVSFFGKILRHSDILPTARGTHIRLRTDNCSMVHLDPKDFSPLFLGKCVVWRDGVMMHTKNTKTGEEVFFDTIGSSSHESDKTSDMSDAHDSAESSSVPRKRKRTPTPVLSEPTVLASTDTPSHNPHDILADASSAPVAVVADPEPMLVDQVEAPANVEVPSPHIAETGSNSQNPQRLPSPPYSEMCIPGQPVQADLRQPKQGLNHASHQLPANHASDAHTLKASGSRNDPPQSDAEMKKVATTKPTALDGSSKVKSKKSRRNHDRYIKRLDRKHATKAAEKETSSSATDAEVDPEQMYWEGAEAELPDDLFFEGAEEQDVPAGGGTVSAPSENPSSQRESPRSQERGSTSDGSESSEATLLAGCVTSFGKYTPLIEFQGKSMRHIMGVVGAPSRPSRTTKGEYMAKYILFDPTNKATSGFNVTLFDKAEEYLPLPEVGDVLLLRGIFGDPYNHGAWGVGASFKNWQWSVFHVKTGKVSSAPSNTQRHMKPEKSELHHSLRLGDWYRDFFANVVSFGGESSAMGLTSAKNVRQHKQISDAKIDEYIDCTVEVLHGFQNPNSVHNVYTLYVTDYTHNELAPSAHGSWCPAPLVPVVLPVEMWDSACALAPNMKPGEYYSIRNLRLRWSGLSFMEGKMVEGHKIRRLDEDELENQPHLVELLQRKRDWEADAKTTGGVPEFPHELIENFEEGRHFNCTVEVVHIANKDDFIYLYVTDYTSRMDLVPVNPSIASAMLSERIVRISINDAQIDIVKSLDVGDFILIRNLRLHPTQSSKLLSGRLGGSQRLITKLNPNATSNVELKALLKRKTELEAAHAKSTAAKKSRAGRQTNASRLPVRETRKDTPSSQSSSKGKGKAKATPQSEQYVPLTEVMENETCPAVFRVRARIVDFFPDDLHDWTVLRCTKCGDTIPKTRTRCTKCDDAMEDETFVRAFFQLYFRIADEDGTTLVVSASDERCSVLRDILPDDVYDDEDAFDMLVARVKPLLGDLLDISDGDARRQKLSDDEDAVHAPLLDLTIGSWLPEGEPSTTESRAYIVLKHSVHDDEV